MESTVKQFTIVSRGRKYFTAQLGKATAKVLINGVVNDLQPDQSVELAVNDLSKRSKYGSTLIFEPIQMVGDIMTDAQRHAINRRRYDTERALTKAERDASRGYYYSQNVIYGLAISKDSEEFSDRRAALKARVDANKARDIAAREEQERVWAAERAEAARASQYARDHRIKVVWTERPTTGVPMRTERGVVVFESFGQVWDQAGQTVCYAYYRPATEEESATVANESTDTPVIAAQTVQRCAGCGRILAPGEAMSASLGIACPDCYDDLSG